MPLHTSIPDAIDRPKLALWLFERDLTVRQGGKLFGCSFETVRLWVLPFGDPKRRLPREKYLRTIIQVTDGAVTTLDFYPPDLRPGLVTESVGVAQ